MSRRRLNRAAVLSSLLIALFLLAPMLAAGQSSAGDARPLDAGTPFYVPKPDHGAIEQIAGLTATGDKADASLIGAMIETPQAVWFNGGTPHGVQQDVKNTVQLAAGKKSVPVLVAYDIPFRDCAQYSAGGATTVQEYKDWIDGFATGIGDNRAVVVLEPDSLGIIPWYKPLGSGDYEWCRPVEADSETAAEDRFTMLNYAVDTLKAHANTSVYLDGTHSAWLNVGDASDRLVKAGVDRADGFFLNVSNYQFTASSTQYGNWISACIAYASKVDPGNFGGCPNQYWNGGPYGTKIADLLGPWTGVALSNYGEWSDSTGTANLNTSGINRRYTDMLGTTQPTTRFIVDTSRNGQGPWQPPSGVYPDPQDWCNPPDRGVGLRPTSDTGQSLLAAYLWVKIPGQSDGQCTRGLGGTMVDPVWGMVDPAAGQWFPQMALQLAQKANPALP